jgi:hypothetical protein
MYLSWFCNLWNSNKNYVSTCSAANSKQYHVWKRITASIKQGSKCTVIASVMWGSPISNHKDRISHVRHILIFHRILLPLSFTLHHNNGCSRILCNISTCLSDYAASHPGSSPVLHCCAAQCHNWRLTVESQAMWPISSTQQCVNASSCQMTGEWYTNRIEKGWTHTTGALMGLREE